eukprot:gene20266-biopygen7048
MWLQKCAARAGHILRVAQTRPKRSRARFPLVVSPCFLLDKARFAESSQHEMQVAEELAQR